MTEMTDSASLRFSEVPREAEGCRGNRQSPRGMSVIPDCSRKRHEAAYTHPSGSGPRLLGRLGPQGFIDRSLKGSREQGLCGIGALETGLSEDFVQDRLLRGEA